MLSASQEKLISHFANSVQTDSLRQCYIIKGEKGLGKKTACRKIAQYIMCETGSACGKCNGCLSVLSGAHPDCSTISNGDKKVIEVDKLREMKKAVYTKPTNSKYRLYIIENAHLMDAPGQNAILKIIEEPPPYAVFIFVCDNLNTILPTILSRSHVLEMGKWSMEDLKKAVPLEGDKEYMYSYSMGSIGALLELSTDEEFAKLRDGVIKTFVDMMGSNELSLYDAIDFWLANAEQKNKLIDILILFLRDVMLSKSSLPHLMANTDKLNQIETVSEKITLKKSFDMLKLANDAPKLMGKYGNFKIAAQTLLIQLKQM